MLTDRDFEGLQNFCEECHRVSAEAGWWDGATPETPFVKLALIHSEISEALEGLRKNAMDDKLPHRQQVEVELADAAIRLGDLVGRLRLDLAGAAREKMAFNAVRPDHKREARQQPGGKRV